jgi:hypothetical protein
LAKTRASMGSEFLRDAGVLVLVFAMLDKVVVRPWRGIWWTIGVTLLIFAVSAVLFMLGVRLEESEPPLPEEVEEDEDD